jgi:hypothetical protein
MTATKRRIGPVGTTLRALVGLGLLYIGVGIEALSSGIEAHDLLIGLVALPAIALALGLAARRYSVEPVSPLQWSGRDRPQLRSDRGPRHESIHRRRSRALLRSHPAHRRLARTARLRGHRDPKLGARSRRSNRLPDLHADRRG